MSDYLQPNFYRFNQDSLLLVKYVVSKVHSAINVLDLGAGTGILGLEIARSIPVNKVTFVEIQKEYEPYLKSNIDIFIPKEVKSEVLLLSFSDFRPEEEWDLIVCNPPYYLPDSGKPSSDLNRNIARSFFIDGWRVLLEKVLQSLSENGKAYFVIKDEVKIRAEVERNLPAGLRIQEEKNGDLLFLVLSRLKKD